VLLAAALKQALGERVKDVRSSKRLTESAVCIVNDSAMDRTLEKLLSRQKDSGITVSAPILEINPSHALIRALAAQVKEKGASSIEDAAQLLLDQAFIIEGEPVPDPSGFARRLAEMMAKAVG
jgi:molecular chaperone HtpG